MAKVEGPVLGSGIAASGLAFLAHLPCCGVPAFLAMSTAGNVSHWAEALEPFRFPLLLLSLATSSAGLWLAFRPQRHVCGPDCKVDHRRRLQKGMALGAAALTLFVIFNPAQHEHDHEAHTAIGSVGRGSLTSSP